MFVQVNVRVDDDQDLIDDLLNAVGEAVRGVRSKDGEVLEMSARILNGIRPSGDGFLVTLDG